MTLNSQTISQIAYIGEQAYDDLCMANMLTSLAVCGQLIGIRKN